MLTQGFCFSRFACAACAAALLSFAPQTVHAAAPATPAPEAKPVVEQLADMVIVSQQQQNAGNLQMALDTLTEAKAIASKHQLPEEGQILTRMIRIRNAIARAEEAQTAQESGAKPAAQNLPAETGGKALPGDGASAGFEETGDGEEKKADKKPGEGVAGQAPAGILLTREECIEIAIQNNLGLRISRLQDRASDIGLREAWAEYKPDVGASVSHSGGRFGEEMSNTSTLSGSVTQRSPWGSTLRFVVSESQSTPSGSGTRSTGYDIELSQPLWRGAGLDVGMHDIRTAKLGKLISRGNLELDTQTLIFQVRSAYADCVRQLQSQQVNQRAVESAQTFLRLTNARERAGQVTRLDVFNSEVQLADRELALTANIRALENAFDNLKQILDVDLEENLRVVEQPVDFGENAPDGVDRIIETDEKSGAVLLVDRKKGVPQGQAEVMFRATRFDEKVMLQEALDNRIELLNGRRNLAIRNLNALLAKDGLGHQIDLVGNFGQGKSGKDYSISHGLEDYDYSVRINYSLPWGKIRDRAGYERALLSLQQSEIELKQVRTRVHRDVREILRALREAEKSILIQGKKVEQAKRSVEAAQISFERGLKDSFDVIQAEDNLLSAKRDFINRRLDYIVRLAETELVVGKATGRIDLLARQPGGLVDTTLPDTLKDKGLPTPAPEPEPRPEDDYFKWKKYERDMLRAEGAAAYERKMEEVQPAPAKDDAEGEPAPAEQE